MAVNIKSHYPTETSGDCTRVPRLNPRNCYTSGTRTSPARVLALIIAILALGIARRSVNAEPYRALPPQSPGLGFAPSFLDLCPVSLIKIKDTLQASQAAPGQTQDVTDVAISRQVNSRLYKDKLLNPHPIDAEVNNAWVTLKGQLPSKKLKARAEAIVRSVKGVRGVTNEIKIGSSSS